MWKEAVFNRRLDNNNYNQTSHAKDPSKDSSLLAAALLPTATVLQTLIRSKTGLGFFASEQLWKLRQAPHTASALPTRILLWPDYSQVAGMRLQGTAGGVAGEAEERQRRQWAAASGRAVRCPAGHSPELSGTERFVPASPGDGPGPSHGPRGLPAAGHTAW